MKKVLSVEFNNHKIIGDIMGDTEKCDIFFLHGAGRSNRLRFETLRLGMLESDLSSCAFDFIGHGETGGDLSHSSLKERTEVAKCVINQFSNGNPLTIVGSSMSGYTAVKLLESYNVKCLILIVPAAYDKKAYELNFNEEFTNCIRENRSYNNSDAWEILSHFTGKVLLISAEKDLVIPDEVINNYTKSAYQAKLEVVTIKNSPHKVFEYLNLNNASCKPLINKITEVIGS